MNRKTFIQTSIASAIGYSGLALGDNLAIDPKDAPSRPSYLIITDIRECLLCYPFPNPIIKIYTKQEIEGFGDVWDNDLHKNLLRRKTGFVIIVYF